MSVDVWWPLYVGDIEKATNDLSPAEFGAYMRLLNKYWSNQGPLIDDDEKFPRITGSREKDWPKIRREIEKLFTVKDGRWLCPWMDKLLSKQQKLSEMRKRVGKRGAEVRYGRDGG